MVKLYETGRGWIYDTSEPMSVYLMTDTPTQVEGDRIRYFWRARSLVDQNAKRHLTEGTTAISRWLGQKILRGRRWDCCGV